MSDEPLNPSTVRPRRVLLKLSGESFSRSGERGINMEEVLAATKKVDVLLAKHGLTMADVAAETGEADGPSE